MGRDFPAFGMRIVTMNGALGSAGIPAGVFLLKGIPPAGCRRSQWFMESGISLLCAHGSWTA